MTNITPFTGILPYTNNTYEVKSSLNNYTWFEYTPKYCFGSEEDLYKGNKIIAQIKSFQELKENWNSYGAKKVSMVCIKEAINIVEILEGKKISIKFAYPLQDGGIQLEAICNGCSINIEIDPTFIIESEKRAIIRVI